MTILILKRLRKSEFGWFQECRVQGREVSRVRGLNLDADIVRRVFRPGRVARFEVLTKWHDGTEFIEDSRPIILQAKNWRLTGSAITGRRFGLCEDGDIIVMAVEVEDHGAVVTWDIVHGSVDVECANAFSEALRGDSMRVITPRTSQVLLALCRTHLLAFGGAPHDTTRAAEPAPASRDRERKPAARDRQDAPKTRVPGRGETERQLQLLGVDAIGAEVIEPDLPTLLDALRSIGYGLGAALADLVDNSINAQARRVRIRIERDESRIVRIVVTDDGSGMDEKIITEAMRFGSRVERATDSLGKFGFGMKLASFSACRSLTVATRKGGRTVGRRWTVKGIVHGWNQDVLADRAAATLLQEGNTGLVLGKSGTAIIWDDIDRLTLPTQDFDRALKTLLANVRVHLGLCFHRFLGSDRIEIAYDILDRTSGEVGPENPVTALDPFEYTQSGIDGYPKTVSLRIEGLGSLALKCHIWPSGMRTPQYRLDGANARQGLYFYRNDRLIQAGGWCQLRTAEAHMSLARVMIELPSRYDSAFKLDVQKTSVKLPPGFEQALRKAQSADGTMFDEYLQHAQGAYRNTAGGREAVPLLPGDGLPDDLREALREEFDATDDDADEVAFGWERLGRNEFFRIDRGDKLRVVLNQRWRRTITGRARGRDNDASVTKVLLYLLLEGSLRLQRIRQTEADRLERLSQLLAMAAQHMEVDE